MAADDDIVTRRGLTGSVAGLDQQVDTERQRSRNGRCSFDDAEEIVAHVGGADHRRLAE